MRFSTPFFLFVGCIAATPCWCDPLVAVPRHLILSVEEGDSSIGFYDSLDGSEFGRIDLGHVKDTQRLKPRSGEPARSYVGMWPHEIEVSPDGKTAYVTHFGLKDYDELIGAPGCAVSVVDVERMCEVRRLYTYGFLNNSESREDQFRKYRAPHGVKLRPHTDQLFVNVESNTSSTAGGRDGHHMLIYNLRSDSPVPSAVWPIPTHTHNFIFSRDGTHLWLFSGAEGVTRLRAANGERQATFRPPLGAIRGLTLSRDETQLIACGSGVIYVLKPDTLELRKTIDVPGVKQFLYAELVGEERYLLAPAVWEGQLVLIDLILKQVTDRLNVGADPVHVVTAPGGQTAYVSHGRDRFISEIDLSSLPTIVERRRIATHDGPNGLATAPIAKPPYGDAALKKPTRKKLRFAACLPLSGQNSIEGQDMRLGYQFWRDSVNRRGGISAGADVYEVELDFRDTRSLSKGDGVDRFIRDLVLEQVRDARRDGVPVLLLGTYPSPPNQFAGQAAEKANIPFVTAGGAAEVIYEQGWRNVFGVMSPARGFLNGAIDMLTDPQGVLPTGVAPPRSILFVSSDDFGALQDAVSTGKHISTADPGTLEDAGFTALRVGGNPQLTVVAPDEGDLTALKLKSFRIEQKPVGPNRTIPIVAYVHPETPEQQALVAREFPELLKLVKQKLAVDIVALTAHLPQSIAFIEAAAQVWEAPREEGFPKAFVLSVGPGNPEFTARLGAKAENVIGASVWSPNQRYVGHDEFVSSRVFAEKFVAQYHRMPSYLTAGSYVCGAVYEEAIRRADSVDPSAIRNALASITEKDAVELFYSRIDLDVRGLNDRRPVGAIQLQPSDDGIEDVVLWPNAMKFSGSRIVWPFPGFPKPGLSPPRAMRRELIEGNHILSRP